MSQARSVSGKRYPTILHEYKDSIREKHRKWKRYKYCKNVSNFNKYKQARNYVVNELRKSKYRYEKDLATRIKSDSELFWSHVRSRTKTKSTIGALMNENGTLTVVDKERANILNNYFRSVFTKEKDENLPKHFASVFTKEKDENLPHFEERYITHPLEELEITSKTVEKSLSSMKAGKSQGPDMIHPRILKETSSQIIEPLTKLFRQSLDEAKLPEDWKKANVTPLFKSGEKKLPENYRPISLTSVVCKLMERIIRNKIIDHTESNILFAKQQHGFRAGRSCTTQLLEFMEEVSEAIDRGEKVDVIYLDFAKAFDKVPHKKLLSKLKGYGIKGKIYDWIKDFLSNRKQRVVINGKFSHWIRVTSGIPQGSVLGPILFLISINDLPDVLNCCMKLFCG